MKGTYCLIIKINKNIKARIGALGKISFKKGYYIYVGSALNNLEKRISRHLRKKKKKFWHIDYLLENKNVKIVEIIYKVSNKKEECRIAKKLIKIGKPIENFGSSDCKCKSHLFKIKSEIKNLDKRIGKNVRKYNKKMN